MISGIHIMVRKSERVRARGDEPVENGDTPPPAPAAPADWQAMLAQWKQGCFVRRRMRVGIGVRLNAR